jgi:hypothetical protein
LIEVTMPIDASRESEKTLGVDDCRRFGQTFTEKRDTAVTDPDVTLEPVCCRYNVCVADHEVQ